MNYQVVTLEICGKSLDVEVAFNYYPAEPAALTGHPDYRSDGEPERYEIHNMWRVESYQRKSRGSAFSFAFDVDFVSEIIEEDVIRQLKEMRGQNV